MEGRAEGRAEGQRETQRADLRRILQIRCHAPVPDDLATAIEAVADTEKLEQRLDTALAVDSLDAFRVAIQR